MLYPSYSLPLLAITNPPCSSVSLRYVHLHVKIENAIPHLICHFSFEVKEVKQQHAETDNLHAQYISLMSPLINYPAQLHIIMPFIANSGGDFDVFLLVFVLVKYF